MGLRQSTEEPKQMETSESQAICPICRSPFQDRALIDGCRHEYCFDCIVRWSEVGHRDCPYCRRHFDRVKHNIKSETVFDWHWTNQCAELKYRLGMLERQLKEMEEDFNDGMVAEYIERQVQLEQKVDQLERDAASWNVLVWIRALWQLVEVKRELGEISELQKRFNDKAKRLNDDLASLTDLYRRHVHVKERLI